MVFPVEAVCIDPSTADVRQVLAKLAESKAVDTGKIEQLKNFLADTKSLSTPDQNQQINDLVA